MDKNECGICIDTYNKTTRFCIVCNHCNYSACRICYGKYILSVPNPKCMSCNKEFSRDFLFNNFPKKFLNTTYKSHREKYLLDIEKTMLPATQVIVEGMKEKRRIKEEIIRIRGKIADNYNQISILESQLYTKNTEKKTFIRKCPNSDCRGFLSTQWKCNLCEKKTCKDCNECIIDTNFEHKCDPNNVETAKLINQDSKPCPKCGEIIYKIDGCFGGDTKIRMWDGSIKEARYIKENDILMGNNKTTRRVLNCFKGIDMLYSVNQNLGMTYDVNSKHTMYVMDTQLKQPVNISINKLMYELMDSPNKYMSINARTKSLRQISIVQKGVDYYYGFSVNRNKLFLLEDGTIVHNCDQIFCTSCHTAFNWKTGKIETGNIHNPHYFEWLRRTNQNIDIKTNVVQCGREIDNWFVDRYNQLISEYNWKFGIKRNKFIGKLDNNSIHPELFLKLCRNLIHFREVEYVRYNINAWEDNQDLRVQFLLNSITEDEFKINLQKREKITEKKRDFNRLFSMMMQCITEILYRLVDELKEYIPKTEPKPTFRPYRDMDIFSGIEEKKETPEDIEELDRLKTKTIEIMEKYYSEYLNLLIYINDCLKNISKMYNSKLYNISDELYIK